MFDVILLNKDWDKSKNTIESITRAKAFKEGKVQLFILDFCGDLESGKGIMPSSNCNYEDCSELSEPQAMNLAVSKTKGSAVTFLVADVVYKGSALDKVIKASSKNDIVSLQPMDCFGEKDVEVLPFEPVFSGRSGICQVDIKLFPKMFHICFSAFTFSRKLLNDKIFDEDLEYDFELKMLIDTLDAKGKYVVVKAFLNCYYANERNFFSYESQFDKNWYMDTMSKYLMNEVKKDSSDFKKRAIMYLVASRYACNLNERDKAVLSPDEVKEFVDMTGKTIRNIEDNIIIDPNINGSQLLPQYFGLNWLRMKYEDDKLMPNIVSSGVGLTAYYKECQLWSVGGLNVNYPVIYFDGKNLLLDGIFSGGYVFEDGEIEITAALNEGKEWKCRRNQIYAYGKAFNFPVKQDYTFQFSIPESELENGMRISFYLVYKEKKYKLGAVFTRAQSKLNGEKESYWVFNQHILSYDSLTKSFLIEDLTKNNLKRHEKDFIKHIKEVTSGMWKIKMVGHRMLYWVTKPFYDNKKIWITMDKLFKAGDNGEYFYRYVKSQKPKGVKIYYVVNEDSPDYKRLKKEYNTVVKFNSIHHKMLALHTDLMLATHVDTMNCNGYYRATQRFFKDLYNARVCCLAHGLTIQKIAQYQGRTFDSTVLYFFASKYEVENCKKPIYDYYDSDMLKLTGHARYDGLKSNDQRIILITPTWRRGTTTGSAKKGKSYAHSDSFKNSEYYKIYNGLISDEKLIECAKKNNYRIVYLLHPAMSSQISDYEIKDGVEIVAATSDISYEKILTESSLMVTDYSGVQFDFAYQKKPLVYYHPDTLPPQYESSGLVYETMGFGPICKNHNDIIATLCNYMDKQCVMEDEYKKRVDDFFEYSDHNNSARIYEEVLKFQDKFDKVNKLNYKNKK